MSNDDVKREWVPREAAEGRHPGTVHIAQLFDYEHLPAHLRGVSERCATVAAQMIGGLPDGPELTTGLRKLLEAKDCFVRAALAVKADET